MHEERDAVFPASWLGFGGKPHSSCYSMFSSLYEEKKAIPHGNNVLAVHHMNQKCAEDHLFQGNTSLRYPNRNSQELLGHLYSQNIYAWVKCFSFWTDE